MSHALTLPSQILPGRILYHVYGGNLDSTPSKLELKKDITKFIILTKPDNDYRFSHIHQYYDHYSGELKEYNSSGYCSDNGIFPPGSNRFKYNLNRLFFFEVDAIDFINECLTGKFVDPSDSLAKERSNDTRETWDSFSIWMDD